MQVIINHLLFMHDFSGMKSFHGTHFYSVVYAHCASATMGASNYRSVLLVYGGCSEGADGQQKASKKVI